MSVRALGSDPPALLSNTTTAKFANVGGQMRLEISARYVVLGSFIAIEAGLLIAFHFQVDRNRATLAFAATIAAGTFALHTYLAGIEERRVEHAHRLIQRWNTAEMVPARGILREITENRLDPAVLERKAKGADLPPEMNEKRACLVAVLNFYEELAIATLRSSTNEDRLYDFFSGIIQQSATRLESWIRNERSVDNEPENYCEFLKLAARWSAWKK